MSTDYPLIGGPYKAPRCKVGRELYDILRGDLVVVAISDAPIPWPLGRVHPVCRPLPILTAELVRAIRTESEQAIVYHWRVSRWAVCRWRRALGVPRFNPGTSQLWSEMAEAKLTPESRRKGHAAMRARLAGGD